MVLNPTPMIFITLIFGVLTFIFVMILPALLELKKPKDAGPRTIMDSIPIGQSLVGETTLIVNMEDDYEFDELLMKKVVDVIAVLPNLEV